MNSTKEVVLITGASGVVAQSLVHQLQDEFEIRLLTRKKKAENEFEWNVAKGTIDDRAFENVNHIIHLAGAGIADKRWTSQRKKEIISSRVDSAKLLLEAVKRNQIHLKSYISASGVGAYSQITSDEIFTENLPFGNDFLAEVVKLWEQSADDFTTNSLADRVVKLRFGMVLSEKGALEKMKLPIQLYIGSNLGSGKQFVPWIHIKDLTNLIEFSMKNPLINGTYNAVSPRFSTHEDLMKSLAKSLHKPFFMPNVPSFLMKLIMGESAVLVLEGSRVSADKVLQTGFQFQFEDLDQAISDLF